MFEQYCLHQKNGNKNWEIFLTASSHKEDERENLMKAWFSKGRLKHVARGKLTLVIVLCKACLHVSSVVKGLYACAAKITNAYMVPFSLLSCQHVNASWHYAQSRFKISSLFLIAVNIWNSFGLKLALSGGLQSCLLWAHNWGREERI